MGTVNASITFVIGYFMIKYIHSEDNKHGLVKMIKKILPIDSFNKKHFKSEVHIETYLLLFGLVLKDFLI